MLEEIELAAPIVFLSFRLIEQVRPSETSREWEADVSEKVNAHWPMPELSDYSISWIVRPWFSSRSPWVDVGTQGSGKWSAASFGCASKHQRGTSQDLASGRLSPQRHFERCLHSYIDEGGLKYQWTKTVPPLVMAERINSMPPAKNLMMFSNGMSSTFITL